MFRWILQSHFDFTIDKTCVLKEENKRLFTYSLTDSESPFPSLQNITLFEAFLQKKGSRCVMFYYQEAVTPGLEGEILDANSDSNFTV